MIYFDQAATSYYRPDCVVTAVIEALANAGNSSRSATGPSIWSSRIVYEAREKIATLLNVKIGDEIEITNNANNKAKATIGYITERYINNYIYISDKYYEDIFGKIPQVNNLVKY